MSRAQHTFHGNIRSAGMCKFLPFTVVLLTIPFFWDMMSHQQVIGSPYSGISFKAQNVRGQFPSDAASHPRKMKSSSVNLLGDGKRQHSKKLIFTLSIILIPSIKTTTFLKWLPFETSGRKSIKKFLLSLALT